MSDGVGASQGGASPEARVGRVAARSGPRDAQGGISMTARLVISWLLVAVLLGYGIIETVITAAKLFE